MFRIISLTILHHQVLGDVHLDFSQNRNDGVYPEEIYTSVIIGVNGIGKSYLMRAISDIFSYLDSITREVEVPKSPVNFNFSVTYGIGAATYEFANMDGVQPAGSARRNYTHIVLRRNGEGVRIGQMVVPARIIASTMTVTDKFTTINNGRYIYKGIRNENSPGTTGTRTMIRKTVSGLLHSLDVKEGFRQELTELLQHMGLRPRLEVGYTVRYRQVFLNPEMTADRLCHIFDNQSEYFQNRNSQLWGTSNFQKLREDIQKTERVAAFLRRLAEENLDAKKVRLNYSVLEDPHRINADREVIEALSALDLLSFPALRIFKRDTDFSFDQSSSGETHLLCQLIGIMSDIEHESIVLIDEPENSAHPSWQINYIGWLKKIFSNYSDSHFIIATHSHFLLTDLKPESSDIIALERDDNGRLHDMAEGVNTFCWTVDDILYRVFHVRNTRNYVFEKKMLDLFSLLENKELHREEIRSLAAEIREYRINDDDPVNILLRQADNA